MATKTSRPPRTLSDIKTHAGRVQRANRGYASYFQIGALELERWRREQEREAAARRIAEINRRIAEIEAEMATLMEGINIAPGGTASQGADCPQTGGRGLRIRY